MWCITEDKSWTALEAKFDWVRDMQNVQQDKKHHAEGNVAIHTQMVLEALTELPAYARLEPEAREILWAAALLHDVEKRSTTVVEHDGSITAHGHARKGALTARRLLYTDIPAPFGIRESIAALVRFHGLPIWLLEKPDPVKAIATASQQVNTHWLALLARADVSGRICSDKNELLYRIDCFEEFCKEQDCWEQPKPFASASARFHYLNTGSTDPGYIPFETESAKVIMMSGLPGAGKDSYIKKHFADIPVISLDAIREELKISPTDKAGNGRVIQLAKEQARVLLRQQKGFIWNATNITRQMRMQLSDLFATYKARVTIIYIETPYNKLQQQNRSREAVVPLNVINKLLAKLEVPAPWEAHEVIYSV